ncbi:hypothetical protein Ro1_00118 [Raoultella phage Ro1]|uniref:Uncharacterized protein n=1 Tax=Raoultella phage Ro1 TaxID=2053702 RepID=A0A2H4YH69_9CAUD|nr:hypothetical protein HWB37_gp118 [Raoultella phage Ro1]AUE23344.1 hypothetical protein Ro1_00118 [Raoultella phage Ro1]
MKLMSVDQSLSHCAVVIFDDGVPVYREMIRTGSNNSKGKKNKDVMYFNTVYEQIDYICERICNICEDQGVIGAYVMEALSLGSLGSATRDLAGLFYCIALALVNSGRNWLDWEDIHTVAPTSVKLMPEDFCLKQSAQLLKKRLTKRPGKRYTPQVRLRWKSHT